MKQIVFTIFLFATLFVACASDETPVMLPDLTHVRIKGRSGETLEDVGKIGSDLDTALDSLRKLKDIPSEVVKEPLEVLFDDDDRLFFGISYGDCGVYSDVLDTRGYYYLRTWFSSSDGDKNVDSIAYLATIHAKRKPSPEFHFFDLSGRRLSARPTKGLYIENGKVKVGVKNEK